MEEKEKISEDVIDAMLERDGETKNKNGETNGDAKEEKATNGSSEEKPQNGEKAENGTNGTTEEPMETADENKDKTDEEKKKG